MTADKRVLFINAVDPASEIENRYRPLWPAYLVSYFEKYAGMDKFSFLLAGSNIEKEMDLFKPHIVAISSVSQNYNYASKYAGIAKKHGCAVMIGGIHITYMPHCLTRDMDVGVIGEGEETFLELMNLYDRAGNFDPKDLGAVNGIVYHDGGQLVKTAPRNMLRSLDELPLPKRSLIGYQSHDYMFTSRGCPYKCVFCASTRFWDKARYASAQNVVDEIRGLVENGVKVISFYDDLFVANKARLQNIAELIVAGGFQRHIRFTCSCRANTVTPDVVKALKAMNVVSVGMGLESGCDRTLKYLKGHVTVNDNTQAINILKDAGIQANASFVIGAPDETEGEVMQTYSFIKSSSVDFFDVYVLTPLPGTPIWDEALNRNLVSNDMDWNILNINFELNTDKAIIMSNTLTRRQLLVLYKRFRRLRLYRILKALPGSPWIKDLPSVLRGILKEKITRKVRSVLGKP
ncbi:MAG: radical SAM protein [Nitrospirae bacterium]|nr:radical SAM protein [Nitrospirota bacterium]